MLNINVTKKVKYYVDFRVFRFIYMVCLSISLIEIYLFTK